MRSSTRLAAVVLALASGCAPRATPPPQKDDALATRIEQLVDRLLTAGDDAGRTLVLDEARAIFERDGVPSVAKVGDSAAYGFVLINMLAQPPDVRRQFLSKVQAAAARQELPADATVFAEARFRQMENEERFRDRPPSHPELRDEISRLVRDDQAVRAREGFDVKKMELQDRRTGRPLKAMFDRHGVPTYEMVGVQAAKDFVVMVQHQPAAFRAAVLPGLKANVDAGQAEPGSYAMVYDRTQRDQGKNQLYGMNFECGASKQLEPGPMDQPDTVDVRRAEMGLMRIGVYARLVRMHSPDMCK
jgi:hypothetical protein